MPIVKSSARLGSSLLALVAVQALAAPEGNSQPMAAREQIDRSFALRAGAKVDLASIAGAVTVETAAGGRAEIHILREAATRGELDCTRTEIESRDGGLSVRQRRAEDGGACRNIRMRQTVRLVVPRNVDLTLDGIAGKVEIGSIDGAVRLRRVAGRTSIAGARSAEPRGISVVELRR